LVFLLETQARTMKKSTVYAFLLLGLFVLIAPMFIMCEQRVSHPQTTLVGPF